MARLALQLRGYGDRDTKPVADCELSFLISIADELNVMAPKISSNFRVLSWSGGLCKANAF